MTKLVCLLEGTQHLRLIRKIISNATYCPNCNAPVPKIKRETKETGSIKLIAEYALGVGTGDEGTEGGTGGTGEVGPDGEFIKRKQKEVKDLKSLS